MRIGPWRISTASWHCLLAWFLLACIARGGAMLPGFSVDDYHVLEGHDETGLIMAQGRFLLAMLFQLIATAGTNPVGLCPSAAILALCAQTFAVDAILRFCRSSAGYQVGVFAAGAIMITHPYTSELFTFRIGLVGYSIAMLSLGGYLRCVEHKRYALGMVCLIAGLMTYQVLISFVGVVALFSLIFLLLAPDSEEQRLRKERTFALITVTAVSLSGYLGIVSVVRRMLKIPPADRAQVISISEVSERLHVAAQTLRTIFLQGDPICPLWLKYLLLGIAVAAASVLPVSARRRRVSWHSAFVAAALFACLPLLSIAVILPLKAWWPVPRVISHVGVIFGLLSLLANQWRTFPAGRWGRYLLAAAQCSVVVGFILVNNQIFADQRLLNAWDAALSQRIVRRLEASPNFDGIRSTYVVGSGWGYPYVRTTIGDLNISAWGVGWVRHCLLNLAAGAQWVEPNAEQQRAGERYCEGAKPWPAPESVRVIDDVAVVCLSKSS